MHAVNRLALIFIFILFQYYFQLKRENWGMVKCVLRATKMIRRGGGEDVLKRGEISRINLRGKWREGGGEVERGDLR